MSRLEPLPIVRSDLFTGVGGDTPIRTAVGFRHARHIRPGDLVVTRDHGLQAVRLVFATALGDAVRSSSENAALRIMPRAIGPMMPARSITLAPDQKVLMPAYLLGVEVSGPAALIAARGLGGSSDAIWRDRTCDGEPFLNLVLDRHEVISAGGVWIDTFRPDADTMGAMPDDQREALSRHYPSLREKRPPFPPCAYPQVDLHAYSPGAR